MIRLNKVYNENALKTMSNMSDKSINLIMTSPPYANARKSVYGGISSNEYCKWFTPFAVQFRKILKSDGSIIINVGATSKDGEMDTWVFQLPLLMEELGFAFISTFIWVKTNPYPGKRKNKLKNAWEFCYHLAVTPDIKFTPLAVAAPMKNESKARVFREKPRKRKMNKGTGSGLSSGELSIFSQMQQEIAESDWWGFDKKELLKDAKALPSNVIVGPTEITNKGGSAVYPEYLPEFFIKLLTDAGDIVYDPFAGTGTTGVSAHKLDRQWILSEILEDQALQCCKRIDVARRIVDDIKKQLTLDLRL